MARPWIEAMRLRTLPVSISGVLGGISAAQIEKSFSLIPALLCLVFALLAQIASNFGNEYYDYKNGLDKRGREGFRRGVTEGDISPNEMKYATFGTLAAAAAVGSLMLFYGGWWLIPVGITIGLFALGYSTGPYPLSHHGLGDVAVILFFGVVPVTLTCYLQMGSWEGLRTSLPISVAIGLLASNVLVVNNYRDMEDDMAVGKKTTVVIFGRRAMEVYYLISGIVAMLVLIPLEIINGIHVSLLVLFLPIHIPTWRRLKNRKGSELNPILGETARNLFLITIALLLLSIFS